MPRLSSEILIRCTLSFSEMVVNDSFVFLPYSMGLVVMSLTPDPLQCASHLPEAVFTDRHEHLLIAGRAPKLQAVTAREIARRCLSEARLLNAAAEIEDYF